MMIDSIERQILPDELDQIDQKNKASSGEFEI